MKYLIIATLFLFVYSCKSGNSKDESGILVIRPDIKNISTCVIDQITGDYLCLNVEMPEGRLLGMITHVVPFEEWLLLYDEYERQIHIFTREGQHVNTLEALGRGPGEYMGLDCFAVDAIKRQLIIYERPRKQFHYYTVPELEYQKSDRIGKYLVCFSPIDSTTMFVVSDEDVQEKGMPQVYMGPRWYDTNTHELFDAEIEYNVISSEFSMPQAIMRFADAVFCIHPHLVSTMYHLSSRHAEPFLQIDFGQNSGGKGFWKTTDYSSIPQQVNDLKMALMPHHFLFSDKFYSFCFFFYSVGFESPAICIYDIESGNNHCYQKIEFRGIEIKQLRIVGTVDDYYLCLFYPYECTIDPEEVAKSEISTLIKTKLDNCKDEGTPIMFMFKPKFKR